MGERPAHGSPRGAPTGEHLSRNDRIHRGSEIRGLLGRGKRTRTSHLDVFHAASPVSRPRWGVVVPRYRHDIVERNLVKRRLREIGRREILPRLREAGQHLDLLVRTRAQAYDAPFLVLRDELIAVTEALCSRGSSSG